MNKLFLHFTLLTLLVVFNSCGKSEKVIKEETNTKQQEFFDAKNKKAISELSDKYNSVSEWDTLKAFTYVLQEMFIDGKRPITFRGQLMDITKSDNNYILRINDNKSNFEYKFDIGRNYFAQISISPDKLIRLKKMLNSNNHSRVGCFVFNVSKIISSSPKIVSDLNDDGNIFSNLVFDGKLLIFKGELIDFYLNEKIDK